MLDMKNKTSKLQKIKAFFIRIVKRSYLLKQANDRKDIIAVVMDGIDIVYNVESMVSWLPDKSYIVSKFK